MEASTFAPKHNSQDTRPRFGSCNNVRQFCGHDPFKAVGQESSGMITDFARNSRVFRCMSSFVMKSKRRALATYLNAAKHVK